MKPYEASLADDARRIQAADEAVRAATSEDDRRDAVRRAVSLRADYATGLAIGFLNRGRPIPGMPLVIVLQRWLGDYGEQIPPGALDALVSRLGGTIERRDT